MLHIYSIELLPIGKASLISNARPIFAAILCFLVLRERLHLADVLSIIASFSGIALITLKAEESQKDTHIAGVLSSLGGALVLAGNIVSLRGGNQHFSALTSVFYGGLLGTILLIFPIAVG